MHYRSRASWISRRRASRACTCCLSASCALLRVLILTCSWKGTQVHQHKHKFVHCYLTWGPVRDRNSSVLAGVRGTSTHTWLCELGAWSQRRSSLHMGSCLEKLQEKNWDWVSESLIHSLEVASERSTGAGVTVLNKREDASTEPVLFLSLLLTTNFPSLAFY